MRQREVVWGEWNRNHITKHSGSVTLAEVIIADEAAVWMQQNRYTAVGVAKAVRGCLATPLGRIRRKQRCLRRQTALAMPSASLRFVFLAAIRCFRRILGRELLDSLFAVNGPWWSISMLSVCTR